jgi:hypothetical protein
VVIQVSQCSPGDAGQTALGYPCEPSASGGLASAAQSSLGEFYLPDWGKINLEQDSKEIVASV